MNTGKEIINFKECPDGRAFIYEFLRRIGIIQIQYIRQDPQLGLYELQLRDFRFTFSFFLNHYDELKEEPINALILEKMRLFVEEWYLSGEEFFEKVPGYQNFYIAWGKAWDEINMTGRYLHLTWT